ncbi:MAG TPA: M48 family metalloprotease [Gemmatimonadales bacterium]|jgi:Zn-dependent protease with chaperone function|nr:M48 family metalloprotease [Gemmatimonadales bacterium]
MMTNEQFDALVRDVEGYARTHRRAYRVRVAALALLGYAYVWLILLAGLAALALLIWVAVKVRTGNYGVGKLALVVLVLVYTIARALWVQFEAPVGVPLERRDAPAIFGLVDELCRALRTPSFHHVLLTDDFNAAVSQQPRLGLLGWYRNYLLLGLPLMHALSPEEFRAVLAHELGHLSREHGRFGAWIYRVRAAWMRLVEQLEAERHWGYHLFDWFLKRWAPYFNAYSFVMAREQEYEADRFAGQLAGREEMGRALIALEVQGERLTRAYWPGVFRQAAGRPDPPAGVFHGLRDTVRAPLPADDGRRWLVAALNRRTGNVDTHPSLADRLKALGVAPPSPNAVLRGVSGSSAADRYLGSVLPRLADRVETLWRQAVEQAWRTKHHTDARGRARLTDLDAKAASGPLSLPEAAERADLALGLLGDEAAIEPLRAVLRLEPDHAAANYALGELLLDRHDETGVQHIERAVTRDPSARAQGYQRIWAFYEAEGRTSEATEYRRRTWQQGDLLEVAEAERHDVSGRDTLLPHDLPEQDLVLIREVLGGAEEVTEAYFVRKAVTNMPEVPFYVLGVKFHLPWYRFQSASKERELIERLAREVPLPGQWLIVALNQNTAKIRKKMRKVPGAQLVGR